MGVTVCNGRIYVVESRSAAVLVFGVDADESYASKGSIKVDKMNPRDIASFEEQNRLYVADPFTQCVWRLSLDNEPRGERFIPSIKARGLFVDSRLRQVLVTSDADLVVCDVDGRRLKRIVPPSHLDVMHSVLLPTGRILIVHTSRSNDNNYHQVSEIDDAGTIQRAYGAKKGGDVNQLSQPSYLALDDRGHVFVADYANNRVVVVNEQLKFERVLLNKENLLNDEENRLQKEKPLNPRKPCRMAFSRRDGSLLVAMSDGAVHSYGLHDVRYQRGSAKS
jgi:DNA-binding beta-propeller fold protein YncE